MKCLSHSLNIVSHFLYEQIWQSVMSYLLGDRRVIFSNAGRWSEWHLTDCVIRMLCLSCLWDLSLSIRRTESPWPSLQDPDLIRFWCSLNIRLFGEPSPWLDGEDYQNKPWVWMSGGGVRGVNHWVFGFFFGGGGIIVLSRWGGVDWGRWGGRS